MFVEQKYKKEEMECPEVSDYDYYDGGDVCDNDPDLDIRTGYRVYAKKGLELNSDYSVLLDTYFRAGEYLHFYLYTFINFYCLSIRVARS